MTKRIDELNKPFIDPNSPESQEFLRALHKELDEAGRLFDEECKKLRIEWEKKNAGK